MVSRRIKITSYLFLTLVAIGVFGSQISSQSNAPNSGGCDLESGRYQVVVVEKSQARDIHVVYDFARGTVSTVRVRRDFSEPDIAVQTKKLGQ